LLNSSGNSPAECRERIPERRNPILQQDEKEEQLRSRYLNAQRYEETSQTRYLAQRPRGLARGECSDALQGTFAIGRDDSPDFVPGRRLVENPNPPRPVKATRKKPLQEFDPRDPISQTDPSYAPGPVRPRSTQDWRPSPITEFANQRRLLLPSEIGLHQRPGQYDKRNKSSVFEDGGERQVYPKKRIAEREGATTGLLAYKYALPYREEPVSEKPQNLQPRDLPRYY